MLAKLGTINLYMYEGEYRIIIDLKSHDYAAPSGIDQWEGNGVKLSDALQDLVNQLEEVNK